MPAYADNILPADPNATEANTPENMPWKTHGIQSMPEIDVVVSGMSGRFPESDNIDEFCKNLFDGVDMISEDNRRWSPGLFGLPKRSGKLKSLNQFDASYFGVSPRQAHCMDPQLRILLEAAHEAVFDAGIHPNDIRGKKIGVYVGVSESESSEYLHSDPELICGYELTGCCRAMFANRLSFSMDLKGPSFAVDTACSSALVAFQNAWAALKSGEIEGAIVAGSNLNIDPRNSLQFHSLNMLSMDGKCKSFDASGDGYVRSEAVVAVYLQRANEAKRIYAHILQARTNTDGNKGEGITFPSGEVQKKLLQEVYEKAKVNPSSVSYIEAHGTGTKAGDPQEVNAIADVLCQNRTSPLLVGSVKSNMGHSESASGLCSLVKVLLSMQRKEIPGNLHYKEPNPDIPALNDGSIKVISENTKWTGKYAALNCFGFGGANVHLLLQAPNDTQLAHTFPGIEPTSNSIPRLVIASGRTEEATEQLLHSIRNNNNPYLSSLADRIPMSSLSVHPFRGYTIFPQISNSEIPTITNVSDCPSPNKPIWYIFAGMGSQWEGCGKRLMLLPAFAAAINRCRTALLPYGLDVIDVITNDPLTNTTHSFVAIAAVQVGLLEVLKSIGLGNFDGVIGHSVGELGCAYADGAMTAEQTVLAAYWRGRAVEEAALPRGGMAAVGLSADEAMKWCGNGPVVVACHNSFNSVTISGPEDEVEKLQTMIAAKDIFCRRVNSGGIAFHHSSLQKAAPRLLSELKKVIPCPRYRTKRWVSSSMAEKYWSSPLAEKASPEYWVNNLVSPVLFAQAITKIPENALVIELAPHALMQAVLRRALPSATQIPIVRKESKDTLVHLLEGLGKVYVAGHKVDILSLYPQPELPVPVTTPSIAGMIKWDHGTDFDVMKYKGVGGGSEFKVDVDINSQEFGYIEGHNIDGRVLFPATGYLVLAWKALAKITETQFDTLPVTFSNVTLHHATVLSSSSPAVAFTVRILTTRGDFEVLSGESVAVTGNIQVGVKYPPEHKKLIDIMDNLSTEDPEQHFTLNKKEIYKELKLRGYHYGGVFQGVEKSDLTGTRGRLEWNSNWISFLDTILQFSLLGEQVRALSVPTRLRKITIEPSDFKDSLKSNGDKKFTQVTSNRCLGIVSCKGVEIHGVKCTLAPRRGISDEPLLESYKFYPRHISETSLSHLEAIKILSDLATENIQARTIQVLQVDSLHSKDQDDSTGNDISYYPSAFTKIAESYGLLNMEYNFSSVNGIGINKTLEELGVNILDSNVTKKIDNKDILIFTGKHDETDILNYISELKYGTFVILTSKYLKKDNELGLTLVSSIKGQNLFLYRKVPYLDTKDCEIIEIPNDSFQWVKILKKKLLSGEKRKLWLVTSNPDTSGLLGMFNCLKNETGGKRLRCIMKEGHVTDEEFKALRQSDLLVNIYRNGSWGTMRHMQLPSLPLETKGQAYLNVLTRGDLASLTWLRATDTMGTQNFIESTVSYTPLNFRDIMLATGKLPPDALPGNLATKDCVLGLEFSGINAQHGRLMGLVDAGGLATKVRSDPLLTWKVPSKWSLKEASTVPVVYATAYYALIIRGRLRKGEYVLIHAGSGGVGQAAISIALHRGCKVFTTVSSAKKRQFLMNKFPQLTEYNFSNSRDGSFEFDIMERTGGSGVDVVLNSLAGELLQASVRCLKEHGRFLEIGKADLSNNTALGMSIFLKNITFHGILLDALISGPEEERQGLQKILYDGINSGEVMPLSSSTFKWSEAEEAFRFMASGKHIGKVILEVNAEPSEYSVQNIPVDNNNVTIPSVYRLWAKENSVYLITGGLGGLGLEICDWLISRGGKNIILTSRKGVSTGYQALCLRRWTSAGANVNVSCQDASTITGAEALLHECFKIGPIAGIFHLAMILEDSVIENQTVESFERVSNVKANGAIALDIASRKLCPNLEYWVTFSSVACGRGNPGQSNYGWANSVSERIVENRVRDGLPGLAIQWGGIGDVGVLASTLGEVEVGGTKPQSIRSVLACLDDLFGNGAPIVSSFCLATRKSGANGKAGKSLTASIANVLGVRDLAKVPMKATLGDLGLDSLMAVEVKQTLEREKDMVMSTEEVRELTFNRLQEIEQSSLTPVEGTKRGEENQETISWIDLPLVPTDAFKFLRKNGDSKMKPLFIASPVQGYGDVLQELANHLPMSVVAMQYAETVRTDNIADMASSLCEMIEAIEPDGSIHLAGYSFGATVACEIAHQMEKKLKRPLSLILLDGSHSYVTSVIETYSKKFEEKAIQNTESPEYTEQLKIYGEIEALHTYASLLCQFDKVLLRESLQSCKSFHERKQLVAQTVLESVTQQRSKPLDAEEIMKGADLFYRRLLAGSHHHGRNLQISSPTLLIRASKNPHATAFGTDYGLSDFLRGDLTVHEVIGSHESFICGEKAKETAHCIWEFIKSK